MTIGSLIRQTTWQLRQALFESCRKTQWDSADTTAQVSVLEDRILLSASPAGELQTESDSSDAASAPIPAADEAAESQSSNQAPTFHAASGIVRATAENGTALTQTLIEQPDGKILVATTDGSSALILRYNSDGSPDTTFGDGGRMPVSAGLPVTLVNSMALQADGRIVLAGSAGDGSSDDILVARLNADGSPDNTFGSSGIVLTDIAGGSDRAIGVAVLTDGRIVVGGTGHTGTDNAIVAIRYHADGSRDATFSGDGIALSGATGTDLASAVLLQSDGKLIVGGYAWTGSQYDSVITRFRMDGSLDTSFDGDGRVTTSLSPVSGGTDALAMQADGKILAVGSRFNGVDYDYAVARYHPDGSFDTEFSDDGILSTDFGGHDSPAGIAVQSDGKIVVVGVTSAGPDSEIAISRYSSNGILDPTFSEDGLLTIALSSGADNAKTIAVSSLGQRLLVAGNSPSDNNGVDAVVLVLNADGSFSRGFGEPIRSLSEAAAFTEDGSPVVISPDVSVVDPELELSGSYSGASVMLRRLGGAATVDHFTATGSLSPLTEGESLILNGVTIGAVTGSE